TSSRWVTLLGLARPRVACLLLAQSRYAPEARREHPGGEPQARASPVAAGGPESAAEMSEKAASRPHWQQLRASSAPACRPRVGLGFHLRSHGAWPELEVAVGGGRVHAGVFGVGGGADHHRRRAGRGCGSGGGQRATINGPSAERRRIANPACSSSSNI